MRITTAAIGIAAAILWLSAAVADTARIDSLSCQVYARYIAGQIPDDVAGHIYQLRREAHRAAIRADIRPCDETQIAAILTLSSFERACEGVLDE